jgi:hypothetical protein
VSWPARAGPSKGSAPTPIRSTTRRWPRSEPTRCGSGLLRDRRHRRDRSAPRQRDLPPGQAVPVPCSKLTAEEVAALGSAIASCIDESRPTGSRDDRAPRRSGPAKCHQAGETCGVR